MVFFLILIFTLLVMVILGVLRMNRINASLQHKDQRIEQLQHEAAAQTLALDSYRQQLLDSHKKSIPAALVAGVSHDMKTPIGAGVMAASTLQEQTVSFCRAYEAGEMTRSDMEEYLSVARDSTEIILNNLRHAAELINSFKQVAVDQSSEQARSFNLNEYLHNILQAMDASFRTAHHEVIVDCADDIDMHSFPGALYQVMCNLIMNSLIHGFAEGEEGQIRIQVEQSDDDLVIVYSDTGCGLSEEAAEKLFEQFYTTKRDEGGSGLGMYLVKSLVEKPLGGTIQLSETAQGTAFQIKLPVNA